MNDAYAAAADVYFIYLFILIFHQHSISQNMKTDKFEI